MKKIIRGKRYDTETAKEMGSRQHLYPGQFEYVREVLYRKNTGEFFLYGEGGAATNYRERTIDGMWCGGEKIKPLTMQEAKCWAEEYLDGEEYEAIFGEVDETGEKTQVCISLDKGMAEKMKRVAAEREISASELIGRLLKDL